MINVARIFVGSLYPILLLVAIVAGTWLAGFSRFPKIPAKYTLGTLLILLGILIWLTLIEYVQAAQPVDFINFNWENWWMISFHPMTTPILVVGFWPRRSFMFFIYYLANWNRNCRQPGHYLWRLCAFRHFVCEGFRCRSDLFDLLKGTIVKVGQRRGQKPAKCLLSAPMIKVKTNPFDRLNRLRAPITGQISCLGLRLRFRGCR